MNPIFITVEKTEKGKFGIQVQHPASHYMDGETHVPIPSRKTWIGHDGQDMQYGTGIEFDTADQAKKFISDKVLELRKRVADGQSLDINSYLLIHHDAVIK
jgi:hypothetical protein